MAAPSARRPLASRNAGWARAAARRLSRSQVTPNMISLLSVLFAALGFLLFLAAAGAGPWPRGVALVLAAACCQLRLVCNLLDGMVAVEGGRGTKEGPFWNEAPDRISDLLFFGGAGLAAGAPGLGWLAGGLAVLTAYLRELGRAEGLAPDFGGPMAKPQRMAVLTGAAVLAAVEPLVRGTPAVLGWALWLVIAGTALTALRRSRRLVAGLGAR